MYTTTTTTDDSINHLFQAIDLNDENNSNVKLLNRQLLKSNLIDNRDYGYKLTDAKFIKNTKLTQQFSDVSNELKSKTKMIHKAIGFYIIRNDDSNSINVDNYDEKLINDIASNGCSAKKCKINYLGDSAIGVYLCKHLDVLLAYSNQKYEKLKLFMFKVVYSKIRLISLLDETTDNNNELNINDFNCHFTNNIAKTDQNLFEQYLNSMMFIHDNNNNTNTNNSSSPRTLLPYALLTFERTKILDEQQLNGHHSSYSSSSYDLFDIDNKLKEEINNKMGNNYKLIIKTETGNEIDVNKDNISKTRLHYERTGELNVKFRGISKLKIKLNDLLKSNMKFLDEEKTCISLSNSTNRLILTYIDKRKKLTTSKSFNNNNISNSVLNDVVNKKKLIESSNSNSGDGGAIAATAAAVVAVTEQIVKKPTAVVNNEQVKLNKKPFSQEQLQQQQQQLNNNTQTPKASSGNLNLNSDSTSLEKHLLKNRKNLSTTITLQQQNVNKLTTTVPQNKPQHDKLAQQRLLIELNNRKYEEKKREEALLRQQQGFWSDYEWKNSLSECPQITARIFYDLQINAMDFELRRLSIPRFESIKSIDKLEADNIQKIEAFNSKVIYGGGFNGIEAGKCGTSLRIELNNQIIRKRLQKTLTTSPPATTPPPTFKRIQLTEYTSKMKTSTTEESIVSITTSFNANSNSNSELIHSIKGEQPLHINATTTVTISSSQETTPFNRQSSSSNLYSIITQIKEEPGEIVDVKKEPQKRKLPSTSLIDELKKRIGTTKLTKYSDNDESNNSNYNNNNNNQSISSTEGNIAAEQSDETESQINIKSLKRKHKSRSKLIKKHLNSNTKSDSSSTDSRHHVNNISKLALKKKHHKKSSKKHQKLKKSQRSSSVSSFSSQSSSSSSTSTSTSSSSMSLSSSSISESLSNSSSRIKPEAIITTTTNFTATPNSDTKISFNSTTSAHRINQQITPNTHHNHKEHSLLQQNEEAVDYDIYDCDLSVINNLVSSNSDPNVSLTKTVTPNNPPRAVSSTSNIITPSKTATTTTQPKVVTPRTLLQTPPGPPPLRPRLPSSAPPNMNIPRQQIPYNQVKNRNFPIYSNNNTPRFNKAPRFNPPPPKYQQNDQFPYYPQSFGSTNFNNSNYPIPEPAAYYDEFPTPVKRQSQEFVKNFEKKHKSEQFTYRSQPHPQQQQLVVNTPLSEQKKPQNQNSQIISNNNNNNNNNNKFNKQQTPVPTAQFRFNKVVNLNQNNNSNKNHQ